MYHEPLWGFRCSKASAFSAFFFLDSETLQKDKDLKKQKKIRDLCNFEDVLDTKQLY